MPAKRAASVAAGAAIAAIAALAAYLAWPRTSRFYSDGERAWPDLDSLTARTVLWDAGTPLTGLGRTDQDYDPSLSGDGQQLYFTRGKAGGRADLYVARRILDGWTDPRPLAPLNTAADEIGPAVAKDGSAIYFFSNRPGGLGGYDLYVSHRTDAGWGPPENLGEPVNSPFNEYDPALSPDGRILVFASNRPPAEADADERRPWRATLREQQYVHDYDIYAVDLSRKGAVPVRLTAVCSAMNDGQPALSPDGKYLYFASDRPGGQGGYDLWRSRIGPGGILAGDLVTPENLGPPINTAANDLDPAVSLEGFGLYFSSNRPPPGIAPAQRQADDYAIYYAASHEVFEVLQTRHLALGHILGRLSWPMLGLLLALVGLVLTVIALARLRRRPGPLATAMAISLVVHLVALSLFSIWEISYRLAEIASRPERFEVSVSIPGLAESELSSRLRAALADLDRPDAAELTPRKSDRVLAPQEPQKPRPELALAQAEPAASEIRLARPAERPAELPLPPRPTADLASVPDPLAAEPPPAIDPKPVRPPDRHEPTVRTDLPVLRAETMQPAAEPHTVPPPVTPEPETVVAAASRRAVTDVAIPDASPPAVSLRPAQLVPSPAMLDLLPPPAPQAVRPAAPRDVPTGPELVPARSLSVARAGPTGPVATEQQPAPAAAARRAEAILTSRSARPAEESLVAPAAPPGQTLATPLLGRATRAAAVPPSAPQVLEPGGPPAPLPPKEIYRLRTAPDRQGNIEKLGGTPETEEAVRRALVWLARHQSPDGRWDVDEFMNQYAESGRRCDGAGDRPQQDVGVTALATLALLGAGHTHRPAGPSATPAEHQQAVAKAIEYLLSGQKTDGDLRRGGQMYDHCLATMVLAESFSLTGDQRLAEPLRRAIDFTLAAQTPDSAWRYQPRIDSDTSVIGWALMALKSAEIAGFAVPPKAYRGAANWLDQVRRGRRGGLYVYQPGRDVTPSMTAEGLLCELLVSALPDAARTAESVQYLLDNPPRPAGRKSHRDADDVNLYYWYYATMALHQMGGPSWDQWNRQVRDVLVRLQRQDGPFAGSWDPVTRWDMHGGRVYTTALGALTLEVYYRFLPFYAFGHQVASSPPEGER